MNDLIAAITYPRFAEINCARSIEGIRIFISGPEMDDGASWEMMRKTLNLSKVFLKEITDLSRLPRHGYRHYIPPDKIGAVILKAWEVMRRFIAFASTGQALSESEYPMLTGEISQTPQS